MSDQERATKNQSKSKKTRKALIIAIISFVLIASVAILLVANNNIGGRSDCSFISCYTKSESSSAERTFTFNTTSIDTTSTPVSSYLNATNEVLIIQLPPIIDTNFANSVNLDYHAHPNIKGIILVGSSYGGSEIDTMHALEELNASHVPIISYITFCYSGCFVITELASSKVLVDDYGSIGFGHNQSCADSWGCAQNLGNEWNKSYTMIATWVAAKRNLSLNYTMNTLPNFYIGQDAVSAGYADQTVENLSAVETYAQGLWGVGGNSSLNFIDLPETSSGFVTIGVG